MMIQLIEFLNFVYDIFDNDEQLADGRTFGSHAKYTLPTYVFLPTTHRNISSFFTMFACALHYKFYDSIYF